MDLDASTPVVVTLQIALAAGNKIEHVNLAPSEMWREDLVAAVQCFLRKYGPRPAGAASFAEGLAPRERGDKASHSPASSPTFPHGSEWSPGEGDMSAGGDEDDEDGEMAHPSRQGTSRSKQHPSTMKIDEPLVEMLRDASFWYTSPNIQDPPLPTWLRLVLRMHSEGNPRCRPVRLQQLQLQEFRCPRR